jgi:excisionase family DNA binding protein
MSVMNATEAVRHTPTTTRPLLTVDGLADHLRIGRSTVYRLIREGEIHPIHVGKRLRFRPEDVDAYLEAAKAP